MSEVPRNNEEMEHMEHLELTDEEIATMEAERKAEFDAKVAPFNEVRRAVQIFAREHAKTDGVADADLLEIASMYPTYDDFVKSGEKIVAAKTPVITHGVTDKGRPIIYKVIVDTIPNPAMPPNKIATNFVRINDPDMQEEYLPWVQASWAKGARVIHKSRYWVSDIDSNTREPGTPDCLWSEVLPYLPPVVEEPPEVKPIDPNDKNSNGTIRWDKWVKPEVMTDYYNTGDGVTDDDGVRKVSAKDFNDDPPSVMTSWDNA